MVILVLMALVGAVLGAWVKPRLIAVPLAIGLAEGLRGLIGMAAPVAIDNYSAPTWAQWALAVVLDPVDDYLPLLAVSGGAALIAAVLAMLLGERTVKPISLQEAASFRRRVEKGRYVRAEGMIEQRPVQAAAEERQKAILGL